MLCFACCGNSEQEQTAAVEKNGDIVILFTSDVHCGVDKGFGYAGLQQIRTSFEEQGYTTLLVDDGDSIQGEPLVPDKKYTLAGSDFALLSNGDGINAFDGAKVLQDGFKLDNQVLIDYIKETLQGNIDGDYTDPYGQGRIVITD